MLPGYPDVFEAKEAIVGAVHAKLGANLANLDASEGHVGFLVSQLDYERVDAVALPVGVQLGHHYAVVGCVSHWGQKISRCFSIL